MELFRLAIRLWRLRLRVTIDVLGPVLQAEADAGPMPHLQALDAVELDEGVDDDVLGFR